MRPLTKQEETEYYKIIEPLQNLHKKMGKFVPAQWMLSSLGINPAVMLVGINPGLGGGDCANCKYNCLNPNLNENKNCHWEPVRSRNDAQKQLQAPNGSKELGVKKNAFAALMRKCFDDTNWKKNTDLDKFNMVWTNLSPFRTKNIKKLNELYAVARKNGEHPRAICRQAMAKLIGLTRPKIVLIAGKSAFNDVYNGLKKEYGQDVYLEDKESGVYTAILELPEELVHIIGFKRRSSVYFWEGRRAKKKIVKLTSQILGEI